MKLPEMKTGLAISALVHAALLLWGLISFSARPLEAKPTDALPVDIISEKQFTEMAKGVKNAPQAEAPKPLIDKVGEEKPVEEQKLKISEKKEVKTATAEPPPLPEPKPADAQPGEAKPEAKPAEVKPDKKPPPQIDPIAETLKKEEARKKTEAKAKAKAQKEQQQKFDPKQIAALLDKREPQRTAAVGERPISTPSLGFSEGQALSLSQNELDALRRRLVECWNPPVGAANVDNLKIVLRVLFKRDGSVAAPPALVAGTPSSYGPAMAESAKRAILTCQPFKMLRPESYEQWKDIEITFDPRDMFGG